MPMASGWVVTVRPLEMPHDPSEVPRCLAAMSQNDTVRLSGHFVVHLDCQRPRDLTPEERILLFRYCWEHVVAKCLACNASFRQHQLGGDLLAHRSYLCPRCRADLTESLRGHLYGCARLPEEVRQRAQDAREAARRLVKDSSQLRDQAEVLMREAEAAIAALRETMRRTVWRD